MADGEHRVSIDGQELDVIDPENERPRYTPQAILIVGFVIIGLLALWGLSLR